MTLFNKRITKTIGAFGAMVFFMSCTNEIPEDTAGLIANDNFVRETITLTPVLSTKAIDTVRTNLLSTYLFGEYTDPVFGDFKADFVGQVTPDLFKTVGEAEISNVEARLEFPISFTLNGDNTEEFKILNFLGDYDSELSMTVKTFSTYLEVRNSDGTTRIYYSDGTNNANSKEELGDEILLGSKSGISFKEIYTQEEALAIDTLVIPLSSSEFNFKEDFIDKYDEADIDNNEEMINFFKGIKVTAEKTSGEGFVFPLNLNNAKLIVSYLETTESSEEGGEDLEVKDSLMFSLGYGALYNLYENKQTNLENVSDKVYVQGAEGYEVSVDISEFIETNRSKYADEQWLVNQASLKIYVDDSNPITDETLSDLYIYGIDKDDNIVVLDDYSFFGSAAVDGIVRYDDTDSETDPYIRFFITDFIKDVLSYNVDGDTVTGVDIKELRVKAKEPSESTFVDLRSSTAKGIVLLNDIDSEKAPKLEVVYSKLEQ